MLYRSLSNSDNKSEQPKYFSAVIKKSNIWAPPKLRVYYSDILIMEFIFSAIFSFLSICIFFCVANFQLGAQG